MRRLIVGLSNSIFGLGTRHGLGADLLSEVAAAHGAVWSLHPLLGGWVALLGPTEDTATVLLWPLSVYNRSGSVVAATARRYGVTPANVTVVHDDIELAPGAVRLDVPPSPDSGAQATSARARGNRGVRSCAEALGTGAFRRIRVGVGRPATHERLAVIAFVLAAPAPEERALIGDAWAVGACLELAERAKDHGGGDATCVAHNQRSASFRGE